MKTELRKNGTRRVQTEIVGSSMTQQQFQQQCDLKTIIKQRAQLGIPLEIPNDPFQGAIQDFSGANDYRQNLHRVMAANDAFMALPAHVRKKFDNDPASLIAFLEDDQNYDEALKLGLLKADAKQQGQNDDKTTNNSPIPAPAPQSSTQA